MFDSLITIQAFSLRVKRLMETQIEVMRSKYNLCVEQHLLN